MSRINESSGSPSFEGIEQSEAEATGNAQRAAAKPEAKVEEQPQKKEEADSYELSSAAPVFSGPSLKRADAKLPSAPRPPLEMDLRGLSGEPLETAKNQNAQNWEDYADQYGAYLQQCEFAMKQAPTLENLKKLQPEAPFSSPSLPAGRDGESYLHRELMKGYQDLLEAKVDRGYELLGKASPGTLTAIAKVAVHGGMFEVEGKASVDTAGHAKAKGEKFLSFEAKGQGVKFEKGDLKSVKVGGKVAGAKVGASFDREGTAKVKVGLGVASGVAVYNPKEAVYGGGAEVSHEFGVEGGRHVKVSAEVLVTFKGMNPDDVKKALSSWLAAPDSAPQPERTADLSPENLAYLRGTLQAK